MWISLVFNLFFFLLSPACGRRPRLGDYKTPSVRRPSRFCINLNISFIYIDIFTKFAGNVYGYENLSLQNFSLIFKNKMAAIANCLKIKGALNLEIFQLASSNLHKSYMARKTSLIVILALVQKTKWPPYHMFKVRHVFA